MCSPCLHCDEPRLTLASLLPGRWSHDGPPDVEIILRSPTRVQKGISIKSLAHSVGGCFGARVNTLAFRRGALVLVPCHRGLPRASFVESS